MINMNSFCILHSIASLVAISLLELCLNGIKGGRRHFCIKPQAKDTDIMAKKGDDHQTALPLFPVVLPRCFSSFQAQILAVSCHMTSCKVKA